MFCGVTRAHAVPQILRSLRYLSTAPDTKFVVDKAVLSKLRKKTGFPLLNCKKALQQFDNDLKQAEQWMIEQAQKEGWSKATKLQGRPMSQGLVGLIQDENAATVLEVNCETDFVARNEKFQDLVNRLTETCHKNFSCGESSKVEADKEMLNSLAVDDGTIGDQVALVVGNLGENIAVRRAAFVRQDPSTVISSYIHAAGPQIVKDRCKLGKFAAVVKVESPQMSFVAGQLCQHIVGMNPKSLGEWNPPPVVKSEKKKKKKGEELQEVVKKEDESRLLQQEFLLEPSLTVKSFLQDNGPKVVDFVRLECGEEFEAE